MLRCVSHNVHIQKRNTTNAHNKRADIKHMDTLNHTLSHMQVMRCLSPHLSKHAPVRLTCEHCCLPPSHTA